jgi:hypothetical protein
MISAHWRERIGHLGPERYDKWWVAQNADEAISVGEEVAASIRQWGLPALGMLASQRALLQLWQSGASPGLTAMERDRYIRALATRDA